MTEPLLRESTASSPTPPSGGRGSAVDDDPGAGEPSPESSTESSPESSTVSEVDVPPSSKAGSDALPSPAELLLASLEKDIGSEKRRFRLILAIAAVFHGILLFFTFPTRTEPPEFVGQKSKVYVMEQVRFKKPPARAAQPEQKIPEKKTRKIPIPDPTPDDPEPQELELAEIPDLEPTDIDLAIFGIPDAPPTPNGVGVVKDFEGDALQVGAGSGVGKPVAIYKPQPVYTEEARQRRIQGVVILSGIVDEEGLVRNLEVIKGLPFGLDRKAVEAVKTWRFEPSTKDGKPVAVYFHFQVGFWLQ